jgi:hypothetical protein
LKVVGSEQLHKDRGHEKSSEKKMRWQIWRSGRRIFTRGKERDVYESWANTTSPTIVPQVR